jgi:hypothetical protein
MKNNLRKSGNFGEYLPLHKKHSRVAARGTSNSGKKSIDLFIDDFLRVIITPKNLKIFANLVSHDKKLQKKIQHETGNKNFAESLVKIGKEYGFYFTKEQVEEICDIWRATSEEEKIKKLIEWQNKYFKEFVDFLNKIRKDPAREEDLKKEINKDEFVKWLKGILDQKQKQNKYPNVTSKDIEETAQLIPSQRIVGCIWS